MSNYKYASKINYIFVTHGCHLVYKKSVIEYGRTLKKKKKNDFKKTTLLLAKIKVKKRVPLSCVTVFLSKKKSLHGPTRTTKTVTQDLEVM